MDQNHSTEPVEYREVPDFPGYRVGSDGTVWTCWERRGLGIGNGTRFVFSNRWRQLKLSVGKRHGYAHVSICCNGKRTCAKAHTLVLNAFRGPRLEGMECRHLDGNRTNNHLSNLVWGTQAENVADRARHGTNPVGERNVSAVLTEENVRKIRTLLQSGMFQREIARRFGVSEGTVSCIALGKTWRHVK